MFKDLSYRNPLVWKISEHLLQQVTQKLHLLFRQPRTGVLYQWPFLLVRRLVLHSDVPQLLSDGARARSQ